MDDGGHDDSPTCSNKIKNEIIESINKVENELKEEGPTTTNVSKDVLESMKKYELQDDLQTRQFYQFITVAANFSSVDFKKRLKNVPQLVDSIKGLMSHMKKEIKEFSDIASEFQDLIDTFARIVLDTKHKMQMVLPYLEYSIDHLTVLSEAMMPDSMCSLSESDKQDITSAIENLASGIERFLKFTDNAKTESNLLHTEIHKLKQTIQTKVTVSENRINLTKAIPKLGAGVGVFSAIGVTTGVLHNVFVGGTGVLFSGALIFPPIGIILLAATLGGIAIGSLCALVNNLWTRHQLKAIAYLKNILDGLNRLNYYNINFIDHVNRSEEEAHRFLTDLDSFKNNIENDSSQRYRKVNAKICNNAINSTRTLIECIDKINNIDIKLWLQEINHFSNYAIKNK